MARTSMRATNRSVQTIRRIAVIALAGASAMLASADPTNSPPGQAGDKATGRDKKEIKDRTVVIPRETAENPADKPERGQRPDRTKPTEDMKELVRKFQQAREAYLAEQKALLNSAKEASEEERSAIRAQMKESFDRWRELQKDLLQEQKDRIQDLKKELQGDLGQVVDEARSEGRGR